MTNPLSHEAQAAKRFMGLTFGQGIIFVSQIATVVWFAGGIKSDVRDATTRLAQHEKDIDALRTDRNKDRDDYSRTLNDLNAKMGNLDKSVGILLERTEPKKP